MVRLKVKIDGESKVLTSCLDEYSAAGGLEQKFKIFVSKFSPFCAKVRTEHITYCITVAPLQAVQEAG